MKTKKLKKGKCPECKERVKGWTAMIGKNACTWAAKKRSKGIDPHTGHTLDCSNTGR